LVDGSIELEGMATLALRAQLRKARFQAALARRHRPGRLCAVCFFDGGGNVGRADAKELGLGEGGAEMARGGRLARPRSKLHHLPLKLLLVLLVLPVLLVLLPLLLLLLPLLLLLLPLER